MSFFNSIFSFKPVGTVLGFLLCSTLAYTQIDSLRVDTLEQSVVVNQTADTLKQHSPKKAAILSAILPGAGQVYNKKYWKLPIIYGAFATCTYFAIDNRKEYIRYRDAYRAETDNDSTTVSEFNGFTITTQGIKDRRDQYKQWMELSYILGGLTYVLQIVDASVDAHLFDFDVSDNLSMRWQPEFRRNAHLNTATAGVRLQFNLKYR